MLTLRAATPSVWLETVLGDFDLFLLDHAAAERKASAVALSLISHYPDRAELVAAMMNIAREELEHYYQVYRQLVRRGLSLGKDEKDAYVGKMRKLIRSGSEAYFLDRLLVAGVVESRGCERFGLVAEAVPDPVLAHFYKEIAASEARHDEIFIGLARSYFDEDQVAHRLGELLDFEAEIMLALEPVSYTHLTLPTICSV